MDSYLSEAPCLFFQTTDNNLLTGFNKTFLTCTGFSETELTGAKSDMFFTISTKIFQQTHLFPLLKMKENVEEIFVTLKTKAGEELPVLVNVSRKKIDNAWQILYCAIVVKNRKKFEDELISAKKLIEKALEENTELNEAKLSLQRHAEQLDKQFTIVKNQHKILLQLNKVISHDMQEPLRKIQLFTDLLEKMEEPVKATTTLYKIRTSAKVMQQQLQKLQQFLWISDSVPQKITCEPEKLIANISPQLKNEFTGKSWTINYRTSAELFGDPQQLELLLYHVLSNSIRFSGNKPVNIEVSSYILKRNKFQEIDHKYKYIDYVRLELADNGAGFDPVFSKEVFNLFSRLHFEKGSGIGLSICKKIVDGHDGFINLESNPGVGTKIIVDLPL